MNQHVSLEADDFTPITDKSRSWLRSIRILGCVEIHTQDAGEKAALNELHCAGYVSKAISVKAGLPAVLVVQITDAGARYLDRIMRAH